MTLPTALRTHDRQEFVHRIAGRLQAGHPVIFFLGAGASVTSRIKTAKQLVNEDWLPRLRHMGGGPITGESQEDWAKKRLNLPDFTTDTAALAYGPVIEALFCMPTDRQEEIERIIDAGRPDFGYGVLARIMTDETYCRSLNTVLTTNFDDLLADALIIHRMRKARIISHHSLAEFIRSHDTKPQIVKLHGDARLEPANTPGETRALPEPLVNHARGLLPEAMLVFIGYGGNDASIADLLGGLTRMPQGGVWWVARAEPTGVLRPWLDEAGAFWVKHRDFDELMFLLSAALPDLDLKAENHFDDIYAQFRERTRSLTESMRAQAPAGDEAARAATTADKVAEKFGSAWRFAMQAERIKKEDPGQADTLFRKAIDVAPEDAGILGNYANFLTNIRKDHDRAEETYQRALNADPDHANNLGNYAVFLTDIRKDHDRAEETYQRALNADPDHANNLGNYANFLTNIRKDHDRAEETYQRALNADPDHANNLGNYAVFLTDIRKDHDRAEETYQRALNADPNNAHILGNYANFLKNIRKDHDRAEETYLRAINADPDHANNLGNYGDFLLAQGRLTEGMALVERAGRVLEHDPFPPLEAELALYRFAHGPETGRGAALHQLKELLLDGARSPGFSLAANVARAREDGHPQAELVDALAKVLTEGAPVETLEAFPQWRESAS